MTYDLVSVVEANKTLFSATLNSFGEPNSTQDSASSVSSTQSSPRGAGETPLDLMGLSGTPPARRGPGRPRLRPSGPAHAGSRAPRPRKPARPLPVPLPTEPAISAQISSAYSFYEFPDD